MRNVTFKKGFFGHLFADIQRVFNFLNNGFWCYSVLFVILHLQLSSARRFVNRPLHTVCDSVGKHNHPAVRITRHSAHRLNKCALTSKEALLIRVQNANKFHLGHIKPFSQKVNADKYIELALS